MSNKIIEELSSKSRIEYLDFRKGDVLHSLADLSTTKDETAGTSWKKLLPKVFRLIEENWSEI